MNEKSPKVSIGMPVYNMASTVQEAIDTVLSQTLTDFELIISDNASDDGTEDICRAAAKTDSRITYHRNPENILGSENFRLTFLLSKGEYFMWAAADDSRRPEMIARCVEALEADSEAVLAYTHTEIIDPETGIRRLYYDQYRLDQKDPAERYTSLVSSLDLGNMIYGVYRKPLLYTIPPHSRRTSRFILFGDAIFLTNVVLKGKIIQIPEMLFIRRRGKSKPWLENLASLEKVSSPDNLTKVVTLPVSESIQEHVRYLLASDLPPETKLHLIQVTREAYIKRFGKLLRFEIDRAVQLAQEGKFMETWNGMSDPHPNKAVQNELDQIHAGFLLDSLERTNNYIINHKGLHVGKAACLSKMGKTREANTELSIAKELEKGIVK